MKLKYFAHSLLLFGAWLSAASGGQTFELLIKEHGVLVFEDNFDRSEADDSKEDLGRGWVTNSQKRAAGTKQADLENGVLVITMAAHADHGVSVRHDAPFDDGVVQVKFRMKDAKGIGFNFNDPSCKVSHAGHICHVGVKPGKIDFRDGKTGIFDHKIREKRLAGAPKAEIDKLTKGTLANFDADLKTGQWYEIAIVIQGDVMTAYIDDKKIGELKSPGIDHAVKQNMAFAVSGVVEVDDLRIWSLGTKK